jgi:hypothetical protein
LRGPYKHGSGNSSTGPQSLILSGLSSKTTLADLTSLIRGGRLLDIFLHPDGSGAKVFFAEGAGAFLAYLKQHDVYLHGRRVLVRWAERQSYLPQHVARRVASEGATRNVVILGGAASLTEHDIRDHLEHIDRLVVVGLQFVGADVRISLNSVSAALFARTCLMSRTAYKGMRMDFYPDECAAVLPRVSGVRVRGYSAGVGVNDGAPLPATKAGFENGNTYSVLAVE